MGVKLIVVSVLALIMTIPAMLVREIVEDRSARSEQVAQEIGGHLGGAQSFLGPTLAIPYRVHAALKEYADTYGTYLVFPSQAAAVVRARTEERHRSLFKVPVYQADLQFDASFDLAGVPSSAPQSAEFDWDRAEVVVGVSDARGALADATLTLGGKSLNLVPTELSGGLLPSEANSTAARLALFGVGVGEVAKPGARLQVRSNMKFSGARRISVLAYGKSTRLTVSGDWPSPGFDGGFLPVSRNISGGGFTADWSVPYIARGVRAEGGPSLFSGLFATALGTTFVEVADPYQSVSRAIKYAILVLGLVFLSYFVFEVTTGTRVHPAQYVLVGLAQAIFYLLLLSLAERTGFDIGFLIAGGATVALLSANAGWIFQSRRQGFRALGCFSILYVLIYVLLRLEDNALLVGATMSFLAVAGAMYFTRNIDWYRSPEPNGPGGASGPASPGGPA